MFVQDPLQEWLMLAEPGIPPHVTAERQAEAHTVLDRLTEFLDHPPLKPCSMKDVRMPLYSQVALDAADLARAQDLYRRVYERGGAGNTYVQESLLGMIAKTANVSSIPFWLDILNWTRPRDIFAVSRRKSVMAALALLAVRRNAPEAEAALWQLAQHPQAEVRELAVEYLGHAYARAERPFPPDVLARMGEIAARDCAFGPRFQARATLRMRQADLPMPLDNPGGVYALKVKFGWDKRIYRTIELRSEQTLDDLHFAIQRAIHWDADHLYSFYMNGELHDQRYAFTCPQEDDRPPWTDDAILGELGLTEGHKFLYYFDYGDSHQFEVEVVGIYPQAQAGKYPRVVESKGRAPRQYG
jgi:hypothetical protein